MKDERGFTLIEMLIVLLIISILIVVTIPNVTKHFSSIDQKGCNAYIKMVQGQVEAYKIDYLVYPTAEQLKDKGYIDSKPKCPNGNEVVIDDETGKVYELVYVEKKTTEIEEDDDD